MGEEIPKLPKIEIEKVKKEKKKVPKKIPKKDKKGSKSKSKKDPKETEPDINVTGIEMP